MKKHTTRLLEQLWKALQHTFGKSISMRLGLLYFLLILASVVVTNLLYQFSSNSILERKVGEVSAQTLGSIQANINGSLANVGGFSKLILSDDTIQSALIHPRSFQDVEIISLVRGILHRYQGSSPHISSVYLFDLAGNGFSVGNTPMAGRPFKDVTKAAWYDEVAALRGRYLLVKNGGGYFNVPPEGEFVSMIRLVNSTSTAKPIGLLILNIPLSSLRTSYSRSIHNTIELAVYDEEIPLFQFDRKELSGYAALIEHSQEPQVMRLGEEQYLVLSTLDEATGWRYISATPFSDVASEYAPFRAANFIIILVNAALTLLGALVISRMVARPLKRLTETMRTTQSGTFRKLEAERREDEIGVLQSQYNIMVDEIERLIGNVVLQQRFKRKAELNMLQAQIKPHFLYNSLEIVAANVMLSEDRDATYELILALSGYYRKTLSKGSDVIRLADELGIVQDYVKIQQARFPGMFEMEYDLEDALLDTKIMKLVLQPLVENAIYHGIQHKGEPGIIRICVRKAAGRIELSVVDDGVGMTVEALAQVNSGELELNMSSFGLRGTIERLKIFYEQDFIYSIESSRDNGTAVTVSIPETLERSQDDGDKKD